MNFLYSLLAALFLASCAGPRDALIVKQFQLRDEEVKSFDEPSVRMEKLRRLHGAVSMQERREKLGQYYTMLWSDPEGVGQGEVELVFEYQQGASASRIKRMVRTFPANEGSGRTEFAVIGGDYFRNGRVTTWKATLRRGDRILATKQSYLWQ